MSFTVKKAIQYFAIVCAMFTISESTRKKFLIGFNFLDQAQVY